MVGYQIPANVPGLSLQRLTRRYNELGTSKICQDFQVYDKQLNQLEKTKHRYYSRKCNRAGNYYVNILEKLTPDGVRHLVLYEDELTHCGAFSKIFPTTQTHKYFRYFKDVSYYNLLLDAWERTHGESLENRENGITRLDNLCRRKYHLKHREG